MARSSQSHGEDQGVRSGANSKSGVGLQWRAGCQWPASSFRRLRLLIHPIETLSVIYEQFLHDRLDSSGESKAKQRARTIHHFRL